MQKTEIPTDYKALTITSPAFMPDGNIPSRYTCDGADANPALDITAIPKEAKSLVLMVEDPDAPAGTWLHWLVWNIPITHHIKEGDVPGDQEEMILGEIIMAGRALHLARIDTFSKCMRWMIC